MAQKALDPEALVCPVCLDLLKTPVSLSCGHSYCMKCVQQHWDKEDGQQLYTCPECRESFSPRPVLVKHILLAGLVEQLKETGLTAPPAELYAGPQDVSCDVCSDRKLKAVQSCLQCVASYCERHLQPHYDSAALQKHQLVAPSHTLLENTCSEHNELKKMFCRTDGKILCLVCCLEKHKDHETVSSASERALRQAQLPAQRHLLLQNIQHKDTELHTLQLQEQNIRDSALTALRLSRDSFRDIILLLETRAKEVEQQIQSEEESRLSRVREIQDQVKQELSELKKSLCELDTLSHTKDHNTFLQLHTALASHSQEPVPVRVHREARNPFDEVARAVSKIKDSVQLTVEEGRSSISLLLQLLKGTTGGNSQQQKSKRIPGGSRAVVHTPIQGLPSAGTPMTRDDFLQYYKEFTLDPNTTNAYVSLSDGNRRATRVRKGPSPPEHPDRFRDFNQVLSKESVTGRCYWEVEWSAQLGVSIAVSYKDIQRIGSSECGFGYNDKSWAFFCYNTSSSFMFNRVKYEVSDPVGSRIGVYLDHDAGVLSFYSVHGKIRLLHTVQTTFSQSLHAGVRIFDSLFSPTVGDTVHFPKLK